MHEMHELLNSMGAFKPVPIWLLTAIVLVIGPVLAALDFLKRRKAREYRLRRPVESTNDSRYSPQGRSQQGNVELEKRILTLEEKVISLRNDLARATSGIAHPMQGANASGAGSNSVPEQFVSTSEVPKKYGPISVSDRKASPSMERDAAKPQPQAGTTYFAPIPEPDGTFKISELKAEASWDALYALQTGSGDSAVVTLYNNPDQFKTAVQAPQRYLDPVCTYRKEPGQETTTIVLRAAGSAVREDQRWRIHTKLEIEFI